MVEDNWAVKALLGAAVGVLGWWNTMLHGRLTSLETARANDLIDGRDRYVDKGAFRETMARVENALHRIETKLDGKVDRE